MAMDNLLKNDMTKTEKYRVHKNMAHYAKRHFGYAALAVVAAFLLSFLEVKKTDYLKDIVDLAQEGKPYEIIHVFLLSAAIIIGIMICAFFTRYAAGRFSTSVMRDVKRDSAEQISSLPLESMNSARSGDLLSRMSSDADMVQSFMESDFIQLMQFPFTVVMYSAFMFSLSPRLFAACLFCIPIFIPLGAAFSIPFRIGSKKYMRYLGYVSNAVSDMVGGISIVKSYNIEEKLADKYNDGIRRATNMAINNDKVQQKAILAFNLARHVPVYICLIYGGMMCFWGEISLGSLIAFSTMLGQVLSPLIRSSQMIFGFRAASASAERLFAIIDEPREKQGGIVSDFLPSDVPAVEFKNITFGYEEGKDVLSGLDFSVAVGEQVGLTGASGCGKSTLLGLVCGFYRPSGGKILIGGIDTEDREIRSTRHLISYVSQDAYLFPISIYENIAMGKPGATDEEIFAAAKAAYAHDFITEFKDGYNSHVGERGCRLSGGQIQRISIARAILKNAPILLLDEATSALDVKAEAEVKKALDNLSRGKTVLVVAHRLSSIQNCDRIVVIDDGKAAEEGTHKELMALGGIYARLNNISNTAGDEKCVR